MKNKESLGKVYPCCICSNVHDIKDLIQLYAITDREIGRIESVLFCRDCWDKFLIKLGDPEAERLSKAKSLNAKK